MGLLNLCIYTCVSKRAIGIDSFVAKSTFHRKAQPLADFAATYVRLIGESLDATRSKLLKGELDDCRDTLGNVSLSLE